MKNSFRLFVALCIINICPVWSQNIVTGTCQQFGSTQKTGFVGFERDQYMGLWFIQRTYDYSDVKGADCMTSIYTATSPGNATIIEQSIDLDTKTYNRIDSLMVFENESIGHYIYMIPAQGVDDWPIDIIETDYDCYSIEWSCSPSGSTSDCYIWVMSRERDVANGDFNERVDRILNDHKIDIKPMRYVKQNEDDCNIIF